MSVKITEFKWFLKNFFLSILYFTCSYKEHVKATLSLNLPKKTCEIGKLSIQEDAGSVADENPYYPS